CLMTVAEAITLSALDRKESRGAHFRDDFPAKNDNTGRVTTVIRKGRDGGMSLSRQPIPEIPPELKVVIEAMK
ncbi:MAG TPA: hypothetical protein VE618_09230, partial [Myxococcaceae bacterium]|nr:hypothetical protein [Myxococcaceae bacterium]